MHTTLEELSHKRSTYAWVYIGGSVLVLISIILWWTRVSVQPERVFWSTVSNSLASRGVTLSIHNAANGTDDMQKIQFALGTTNTVHAVRTVKQAGTVVNTESVGDTKRSFTRYTDVSTAKKNADGKVPDLSNVIGVWAESSSATQSPLLQQVALGTALPLGAVPMPIGMLQPEARKELIGQMKSRALYQTQFDKIKRQQKAGRLLYTYDITMQPVLYLSVMKSFAQSAGLKDLDNLDPDRYENAASIAVSVTVDAHAKQIVQVSSKQTGYSETFSGHGVAPTVTLPKTSIPMAELQHRLSELE